MPRIAKHLFVIVLLVIIGGCSGGGCSSGCSSCGITPLAEGFPAEKRVENGASVRVTDSGLKFIQDNVGSLAANLLGGGVLTFEIPEVSGSQVIDYAICQGGPNPNGNPPTCVAEVDVGNTQLSITSMSPHEIHITGPLPVRLQDLPAHLTYFCVPNPFGDDFCVESTIDITLNGNNACPGSQEDFALINLDVDISIEIDNNAAHSRYGYSRVKINSISIDKQKLSDSLHFCGSFDAAIIEALKGILLPLVTDPLIATLKDQIDQQLCQKSNPALTPTCPNGTNDVNGVCRYGTQDSDECASIVLGTDGHVDLAGLLASVSPGTKGGLDFLFAAGGSSVRDDGSVDHWGDLNPKDGGATLGFYGGAEPMPISGCVRLSDVPIPTGIPIPDELLANTVTDWPADLAGPHFGLALSERFMNHAMNGIYNSGLLCIGITTDTVALLNSGTIGLLAASLKDVGIQREQQPIAIVVRPGEPPKVAFGNGTDIATDPLLDIKLNNASFDFYMWSLDRFIRVMTATFDLDVPINLVVTPEGLAPVLDKVGVTNGKVTNAALLREDPDKIATALGSLIASQVGQAVGGGIAPIDLSSSLASLGLTLDIPESVEGKGSPGLRKLVKASDNYLGIFATFGLASAAQAMQSHTSAKLVQKNVDKDGLKFVTMTPDNAPFARIHMSSQLDDGSRVMEYAYRVDHGVWHPFTRERMVDIHDDWLRVQGRHVISVRSRVAGQPSTLDPTPATFEIVIDAEPPKVAIAEATNGQVKIDVSDLVSTQEASLVRVSLDGGAWSEWRPAAEAALFDVGYASEIDVEAKDEEGNVGTASQALIRGRAPAGAAAGGCGCTVAGNPSPGGGSLFALSGLALFGVLARLARRPRREPKAPRAARGFRLSGRTFGLATMVIASTWTGCSCGDDVEVKKAGEAGCVLPGCETLAPGLIGAYTSVATSGDTVWLAGYAEADWNAEHSWGDLVIGAWNADTEVVDWKSIDGVPTDPPPDPKLTNVNAYRGGQTEPGDDVGLWTSIQVDPSGNPAVAYYDRTNKALRFAHTADGKEWTIDSVDSRPSGDVGRYAKLLFLNGTPVITYLAIEPGADGSVQSSIRVATGSAGGTWSFEEAVVDPATPCRKAYCGTGKECVKATGLCTATLPKDSCGGACASGTACVDQAGTPGCADTFDKSHLDSYPEAVGDYVAVAPDGKGSFGIAFYDRIRGNLGVAHKVEGAWTTMVVDGASADGTDTGDMGIGASLFIDGGGAWHIAYVDGLNENVRYVRLDQGTTVTANEVVDDGLSLGGVRFEDGQHIVGDDSSIVVTPSGEVHITYQDATDGKLRFAVGAASGDVHTWTVSAVKQDGFAGAFSNQVMVGGAVKLVSFWRIGGQEVRGDVALVSP